jgi:hypothetical protein
MNYFVPYKAVNFLTSRAEYSELLKKDCCLELEIGPAMLFRNITHMPLPAWMWADGKLLIVWTVKNWLPECEQFMLCWLHNKLWLALGQAVCTTCRPNGLWDQFKIPLLKNTKQYKIWSFDGDWTQQVFLATSLASMEWIPDVSETSEVPVGRDKSPKRWMVGSLFYDAFQ